MEPTRVVMGSAVVRLLHGTGIGQGRREQSTAGTTNVRYSSGSVPCNVLHDHAMSFMIETRARRIPIGGAAGAVVAAALLLLLSAAFPAEAQVVRVLGSVQWIAGSRMQVLAEGGASVAVDLREADQSSYRALRSGECELAIVASARAASRK